MWDINSGRSVKRDGIFQVLARFNASSYLSDVFISEREETISYPFQDSGKRQQLKTRNAHLSPILFSITAKRYVLVTPIVPLGFTPSLF